LERNDNTQVFLYNKDTETCYCKKYKPGMLPKTIASTKNVAGYCACREHSPIKTSEGTGNGSNCVIPFTYYGKTYHSCTKANHTELWCATSNFYMKDGLWGNCDNQEEILVCQANQTTLDNALLVGGWADSWQVKNNMSFEAKKNALVTGLSEKTLSTLTDLSNYPINNNNSSHVSET
jgi:hypothetical protein